MANTKGSGDAQDAAVATDDAPESTRLGDDRAVLKANVEAMREKVALEKANVKAAEEALKTAEEELESYKDDE